jgi:uncharacterized membrane protein
MLSTLLPSHLTSRARVANQAGSGFAPADRLRKYAKTCFLHWLRARIRSLASSFHRNRLSWSRVVIVTVVAQGGG